MTVRVKYGKALFILTVTRSDKIYKHRLRTGSINYFHIISHAAAFFRGSTFFLIDRLTNGIKPKLSTITKNANLN